MPWKKYNFSIIIYITVQTREVVYFKHDYKRMVFAFPRYCLRVHRRVFMDFSRTFTVYYKEAKKRKNWLNLYNHNHYFENEYVWIIPADVYLLIVSNKKKENTENLFKVNNKDTRTRPLASFSCLYY